MVFRGKGQFVDVFHILTKYTMDLIVELAFGGDFDSATLLHWYEFILKNNAMRSKVSLQFFLTPF